MGMQPHIVAHRYGNDETLLEEAIKNTAVDEIECDVRFSGNRLVVRHNPRTKWFPLTVERWKRGLRLLLPFRELLLKDVIERLHDSSKVLMLDIKSSAEQNSQQEILAAYASTLIQMVLDAKRRGLSAQYSVSCGVPDLLRHIYQEIKRNSLEHIPVFYSLKQIGSFGDVDAAYLKGFVINKKIISQNLVDKIHEQGKEVYIYTARSSQEIRKGSHS